MHSLNESYMIPYYFLHEWFEFLRGVLLADCVDKIFSNINMSICVLHIKLFKE